MPQALSLCSRALEPQLLKPTCPRAGAQKQGKPLQCEDQVRQLESSPCSLKLGRSLLSSKDPAQPKTKIKLWYRNFHHPRKFPHTSLQSITNASQRQLQSNLYYSRIVLPVLKLHKNGITYDILCILIFWLNIMFLRFLYLVVRTSVHTKSLQSCLTLCDPMDCSPPGSSVNGILQARILKWVAIPFSTYPGIEPRSHVFCIGRQVLYHWPHWGALHAPVGCSLLLPSTLFIVWI